ncbi:MAG: SusD/RagB family nutrient-binding outer membrane lipoprotein [Mongoliibacter sp.]|nr:SusD/RagB family nutrient-binding outer membrane lipoprotein [Mongoliibacter sp.]TVP42895.1 MAG: SusD/RagB family nutrient-binding outer membrane lipoprotein [Mongoliibacter sp.]
MKIMKKIYSLLIALSLVLVSSCDLDLQQDPNNVAPETASLNLVLNRIQIDFATFFNQTGDTGMRLTRMLNQGSNIYEQTHAPVTQNARWTNAYANILNNIKFLVPLAEEANFRRHAGMARVMQAYTLMTLVDQFDDVPWSEALDPGTTLSPNLDEGSAVYAVALATLQAAREDFAASSIGTPQDLFYNGTWANWVRLINALELKYHLNRKLVDPSGSAAAINALIAANNFIQPGQEFVFRFGTNLTDPDSRHPRFASQYQPGGGGDYQSTWFMWRMTEEKSVPDPRARFYFYRQVIVNPTDADQLRCLGEIAPGHYLAGGWPFCLPGTRGYWGRDHLNAEGIPPDGEGRTAWGVYPAGGRFDNNAGAAVSPTAGAGGQGVHPIMLPSFVDFMIAEAIQTMDGVSGDAKAYLDAGIQKSMNYVRAQSVATTQAGVINTFQPLADYNEQVEDYLEVVDREWSQANADDRMDIIGREYWLALFGNGNESYNLYRRTGKPGNMQPGLLENFGTFPRSMFYPNNHVVTNNNARQKSESRTERVFWDTNPEGNSWVY